MEFQFLHILSNTLIFCFRIVILMGVKRYVLVVVNIFLSLHEMDDFLEKKHYTIYNNWHQKTQ